MSVEFVDTNILIFAHDSSAGTKYQRAVELLTWLVEEGTGALSIQVLAEFYWAATRKLAMKSQDAEEVLNDLSGWTIHQPAHSDLMRASRLHRRYNVAWWDALVLNSAIQLGCSVLWSEDLGHGQHYDAVTVRNPFHMGRHRIS